MSQDRTGPIVHVRENSDTLMDEMFNTVKNAGTNNTGSAPTWRQRNLPASFFRPPEPHKQAQMGIGKDGQSQGDSPMYHGHINAAHMRAHSSPASLQQTLNVAPPPPASSHQRQHSYDLLDEQPLPAGWDMAKTPQGQRYYLNHLLQITTWNDPRKTHAPGQPNGPGNNNNNSTSNLNTPPGAVSPVPSQSSSPTVNLDSVPLPQGWEKAYTSDCEVYFINHIDRTTSWFHPAIPPNMQRPGMKFQQQQQQQHPASALSPPQEQMKQLKLHQLQMEQEVLKKRQDEIARQAQTLAADHNRQESGDSGLGGMGTSYSLPRTPEGFLGTMEDMDTEGPKPLSQTDLISMDMHGDLHSDMGEGMDSDDLVPSLQEEIPSDLLKDVETVLSNKDNPLTWL